MHAGVRPCTRHPGALTAPSTNSTRAWTPVCLVSVWFGCSLISRCSQTTLVVGRQPLWKLGGGGGMNWSGLGFKAGPTSSQGRSLCNTDRPCAGCQYLLPCAEAVSLYDHVHQADVVAASGHRQGSLPLLQGRNKTKGSQRCYRRGVGWPLASAANVPAPRKRFPVVYPAEQKGFLGMTRRVEGTGGMRH